ncbi:MAG: kynureninase [Acidobacteriota bacterium]
MTALPSPPLSLDALTGSPNALAPHYSAFRVAERLLLTGHSHQAWPDRARQGQLRAFDDAAAHADEKWSRAFAAASRVETGFRELLDDRDGSYVLAGNTHELLIRFLSALPLRERPRLVTTDGEFHTIRRQLDRLAEEGLEVVRVSADEPASLADRLAAEVDDRTAAVLVSSVLFGTGRIVPNLAAVVPATQRHGCELLVDTYHALGAVPFQLPEQGLGEAFVVGGGYKYLQLGEGNCFMRVPPGRDLRPVITGWFAEFADLAAPPIPGQVAYGHGADAFIGATYDPTSHYRAAEVFDFFATMGLTPTFLRQVSQHQVGLLTREIDALDLDPRVLRRPVVSLAEIGGFLMLETPHAEAFDQALRERGVLVDHRGTRLRLGPAPYLSDRQLRDVVGHLGEVATSTTTTRTEGIG